MIDRFRKKTVPQIKWARENRPRSLDGAARKNFAAARVLPLRKRSWQETAFHHLRRGVVFVTQMCREISLRIRSLGTQQSPIRSVDGVRISNRISWQERVFGVISRQMQWGRLPLTGMFVLGVVTAVFVSDNFGQSVSAGEVAGATTEITQIEGSEDLSVSVEQDLSEEDLRLFSGLLDEFEEKEQFEGRLREMVKGYPIERMVPYISGQDRVVAIFLVSIAKKESNWGKRVPVLDGQDCYNYWGFRALRVRMGTGGHTCFDGPEDAVESVSKRIKKLVEQEQLNTPSKMIVWKCGYSCDGHSRESVRKWISDVNMYFQTLNSEETGAVGSLTSRADSRKS